MTDRPLDNPADERHEQLREEIKAAGAAGLTLDEWIERQPTGWDRYDLLREVTND